jgi:hypothetical protein
MAKTAVSWVPVMTAPTAWPPSAGCHGSEEARRALVVLAWLDVQSGNTRDGDG